MAETYCPYCGAAEPDWNGAHADAEWQDLMHKQDNEIESLRRRNEELLRQVQTINPLAR
jgi:hypothetical protein